MAIRPVHPANLGPFIGFETDDFRSMIIHHGSDVVWSKAVICACRRLHTAGGLGTLASKRHRVDCEACHGTGVIYTDTTPIKAIVNEAAVNPQYYQIYGSLAEGMARLTLFPEHVPAKRDRFTVTSSIRVIEDERRTRRAETDDLTFPIVTRETAQGSVLDPAVPEDGLITTGVDYARRANADGTIGPILVLGTDFEVVGGQLHWLDAGDPPAVGEDYIIRYYAHPVYVSRRLSHPHRDTWLGTHQPPALRENPRRVDCWLLDLDPFKAEDE